jgi:hypothetical protein
MATVMVTTRPVASEPRRTVVRKRITAIADPKRVAERRTMEMYWSKKI